jgi:hypothetical protein
VDVSSPKPFFDDVFTVSGSFCIVINWSCTFWFCYTCFLVYSSIASYVASCTW